MSRYRLTCTSYPFRRFEYDGISAASLLNIADRKHMLPADVHVDGKLAFSLDRGAAGSWIITRSPRLTPTPIRHQLHSTGRISGSTRLLDKG